MTWVKQRLLPISSVFSVISIIHYNRWLISSVSGVHIKGYETIWVIGDEFVQMTFEKIVKQNDDTRFYMKENFNLREFSSTRLNGDIISRIINNLINVMNQEILLLKLILVVLDNDLTRNINHDSYGISRIIGSTTEHIVRVSQIHCSPQGVCPAKGTEIQISNSHLDDSTRTLVCCLILSRLDTLQLKRDRLDGPLMTRMMFWLCKEREISRNNHRSRHMSCHRR